MDTIKRLTTQVLSAPEIVPKLAKYLASQTGKDEAAILSAITRSADGLEGKQYVRKFYSVKDAEVVEDERSVISVISTATVDRDLDIMDPDGVILTDYQKNRVVLYCHDRWGLPIGRNIWIKKKKGVGLVAKTQFAPRPSDLPESQPWLPDQIYHLMKHGYLSGFSISFIPIEEGELTPEEIKRGAARKFSKWLLLEYSVVPIPANSEAIALEIKSGAISHPRLLEELTPTPEEEKIDAEKSTPADPPTDDDSRRIAVSEEEGIFALADKAKSEVRFEFAEAWSEEESENWVKLYGKQIADAIQDEVIAAADGYPDPDLLEKAIAEILKDEPPPGGEQDAAPDESSDADPPHDLEEKESETDEGETETEEPSEGEEGAGEEEENEEGDQHQESAKGEGYQSGVVAEIAERLTRVEERLSELAPVELSATNESPDEPYFEFVVSQDDPPDDPPAEDGAKGINTVEDLKEVLASDAIRDFIKRELNLELWGIDT